MPVPMNEHRRLTHPSRRQETRIMKHSITLAFGISTLFAIACGAPAGTQPHAMSAAEHESASQQEAQTAGAHQAQTAPAEAAGKPCALKGERGFCWKSEESPNAQHERDAARHRELAAQHRTAMQSLSAAEAQACSGIPDDDRILSPFAHGEEIRSVSPLREEVLVGKSKSTRTSGAEITFQAVPGLTAEWLQRVVDCHLARNSAIGHEVASTEMAYCPLTQRGVTATVRSTGDGFAVAVRSDDAATAREILQRAESLKTSTQ
jgi:hypothetical protein